MNLTGTKWRSVVVAHGVRLPALGVGAVSCFERSAVYTRFLDLKPPSDERAACCSPQAPPPTTYAARESALYEAAVDCKVLLARQGATCLGFIRDESR